MEAIREWAESLIISLAVICAVSFIVPNGTAEKAFKIITALFLMVCFVAPVKGIKIEKGIPEFTEGINEWIVDDKLQETVEKEIADTLSAEIKAGISAYLENLNIINYSVDTKVNIINSTNISIAKIIVSIPLGSDTKSITKYIENNYEITPEFIFIGEANNESE